MPNAILLPTDGNPRAAPAIEHCMRLARAHAATVIGLYLLPCEDLSTPEDHSYLPERERPSSIIRAGEALRAIKAAAAHAGVPCVVLTRCGASPYSAAIAAARERQCDLIFLDAMARAPDDDEQAALEQSGLALAGATVRVPGG
jgi:nucleotide-binding universal stress UspA family protein